MRSTAQREAAAFPLFFVGLWAVGLFLLWACFLCGFYATASLGLFPCPSRLAGARRRPSQFAMVVASLMGGLASFVGFMRRRPWACSLAPVDLQGRAGAPAPPARGGCPWYPAKKQPLSRLPPFAPSPLTPRALPGPAPSPVVLPAAGAGHFLFSRNPPRSFSLAPLAPSPNVKNGPQSRFLPFCPRRPRFALPPPTELRAKEKAPESGGFPLRKKLHLQQLF